MHRPLHFLLSSLARLPWGALYALSSGLFFVLDYLVRYRRSLVNRTLQAAFPEKNSAELQRISAQFYRNFCDQIVETIKLLRATPEEISARFQVDSSVYETLGMGKLDSQSPYKFYYSYHLYDGRK